MAATLRRVLGIAGIRDVFVAVAPVHVRLALSLALCDVLLYPDRRECVDGIARAFARDGNAWGVRKFHRFAHCRGYHCVYVFVCEEVRWLMLDALRSANVKTVRAVLANAYEARLLNIGTNRESVFGHTGATLRLLLTFLNHEPQFPPADAFARPRKYLELLICNTWRYNRDGVKSVQISAFNTLTFSVERYTYTAPSAIQPKRVQLKRSQNDQRAFQR
jgi:hypothetical protein